MSVITYDPEVKILMIKIRNEKIVDSSIQKNCVVDYDKDGNVVNIEVLDTDLEDVLRANSLSGGQAIKVKKNHRQ